MHLVVLVLADSPGLCAVALMPEVTRKVERVAKDANSDANVNERSNRALVKVARLVASHELLDGPLTLEPGEVGRRAILREAQIVGTRHRVGCEGGGEEGERDRTGGGGGCRVDACIGTGEAAQERRDDGDCSAIRCESRVVTSGVSRGASRCKQRGEQRGEQRGCSRVARLLRTRVAGVLQEWSAIARGRGGDLARGAVKGGTSGAAGGSQHGQGDWLG